MAGGKHASLDAGRRAGRQIDIPTSAEQVCGSTVGPTMRPTLGHAAAGCRPTSRHGGFDAGPDQPPSPRPHSSLPWRIQPEQLGASGHLPRPGGVAGGDDAAVGGQHLGMAQPRSSCTASMAWADLDPCLRGDGGGGELGNLLARWLVCRLRALGIGLGFDSVGLASASAARLWATSARTPSGIEHSQHEALTPVSPTGGSSVRPVGLSSHADFLPRAATLPL